MVVGSLLARRHGAGLWGVAKQVEERREREGEKGKGATFSSDKRKQSRW